MNSWSSGQPKSDADTFFPTLHPLFLVIFATTTVVEFVLLHSSRFNFHYTQRKATPTQKLAQNWHCSFSWLPVKDYKGHSLVQTSFTEPPNRMPQHTFFSRTRDLLVSRKMMQTLFFHPLSPFPFPGNFCNYNSGGIYTRFSFHCYIQCEATPTQKSARKWRSDLSWLLAWKIKRAFTCANQLHWTAWYISDLLLSV